MRLTGLPNTERYPEAVVARRGEFIGVVFGGRGDEQAMNIPLKYVGGDAESAELWLLADLKRVGDRVRRETDGGA